MMFGNSSRNRFAKALCAAVIPCLLIAGGCTNQQVQPKAIQPASPTIQSASLLVGNNPVFSNVPVYKETSGLVWVPLEETAKALDFDVHYTNAGYSVGNTDSLFHLKMDHPQATAADQTVGLPQAPKLIGNKPYVTTQALSTLLGSPVNWNNSANQVVVSPIDDSTASNQQNGTGVGTTRSLAATAANTGSIINFAKSFLGTPYQFAAGPYAQTHTFDCSSFVQYVYAHFGVNLPRSSRAQSLVGQTVSVDQLQPGDLLFFYTPGRYASNKMVGHVGMYAGNGQIIHTFGHPGVTISPLNGYWRNRLLSAKRVI
ncbi:C40 family peptidase [Gordoniibacillus kamchatkensis]|uniref:C40 family peptidase n=1 Tax=Gordoniibacillus kamchatkensis TaxID=1590651 RepID=UPI000696EF2B|nr:C40 family peptidase [Paenibacillus sp. VKM B-2647]